MGFTNRNDNSKRPPNRSRKNRIPQPSKRHPSPREGSSPAPHQSLRNQPLWDNLSPLHPELLNQAQIRPPPSPGHPGDCTTSRPIQRPRMEGAAKALERLLPGQPRQPAALPPGRLRLLVPRERLCPPQARAPLLHLPPMQPRATAV